MRHKNRPGDPVGEPAAMTTVAAQMSAKLRVRLEKIARDDDRNLSYVIRKACEEYAERHERSAA
jgi:predicted transcriptional regulator